MTLTNILKGLMIEKKEIPLADLPTQGYFYAVDMKLFIKSAELEDIFDYEQKIDKHNIMNSIECIKNIVSKNVTLSKDYCYDDLKSVDVIFIFLEIVRFTKKKDLLVKYVDSGVPKELPFCPKYFNYFDFKPFLKFYDSKTREFVIDGFRFSFPCIGIENSLSRYLVDLTIQKLNEMKDISYDFLFFLAGKNSIQFEEIENIIQIFNFDIEDKDKETISNIISYFNPILSYSLKIDGIKVELKSSMKLESIWQV